MKLKKKYWFKQENLVEQDKKVELEKNIEQEKPIEQEKQVDQDKEVEQNKLNEQDIPSDQNKQSEQDKIVEQPAQVAEELKSTVVKKIELVDEINPHVLMKEEVEAILDLSSVTNPTNIKATINCGYYSSGITVKKNDVVRIIYRQDDFIYIKNKKGSSGFIPFSYCVIVTKDTLSDGKKRKTSKKDKSKYQASEIESESELKSNKKEIEKSKKNEKRESKGELKAIKRENSKNKHGFNLKPSKSNKEDKTKSVFYIRTEIDISNDKQSEADDLASTNQNEANPAQCETQLSDDSSITVKDKCNLVNNNKDIYIESKVDNDLVDDEIEIDSLDEDTDDNLNKKVEQLRKSVEQIKLIPSSPIQSDRGSIKISEYDSTKNIQENKHKFTSRSSETSSLQSDRVDKTESGFSEMSDSTTDISETNRDHTNKSSKVRVPSKEKVSKKLSDVKKLKDFILKKKKSKSKEDIRIIKKGSKNMLTSSKLDKWTGSQVDLVL